MKGRGVILAGLAALCLGVMWVVAEHGTPQQLMTVAPVVLRGTEVLQAVDQVGLAGTQLSESDEVELGRRIQEQVLSEFPGPADEAGRQREKYLQAVLAQIAPAAGLRRPPEARLIQAPFVNAFALPGGTVVVTDQMFQVCTSEATLAAVLSHELGHEVLKHPLRRLQYERVARRLGGPLVQDLAALGYELYRRGYSARDEEEADRRGLQIMAKARYHPQAMAGLLLTMSDIHYRHARFNPGLPEEVANAIAEGIRDYLDTHPPLHDRLMALGKAQQELGLDPTRERYFLGSSNRALLLPRPEHDDPGEWFQGPLVEAWRLGLPERAPR